MTDIALPKNITVKDLEYPSHKSKDRVEHTLTMYYTQRMGWVITTLGIKRGKRGHVDRSYAVDLNGRGCRVGNGPHVLRTITVYVRTSRIKALQSYIDLHAKGEVSANEIRDRISSRRVEGAERRARGEYSWMWSK